MLHYIQPIIIQQNRQNKPIHPLELGSVLNTYDEYRSSAAFVMGGSAGCQILENNHEI